MIDLEGRFGNSQIPTLIVEAKWDLTWRANKPDRLLKNHPAAELVMFKKSGHSPFADEPEKFFTMLRNFFRRLKDL